MNNLIGKYRLFIADNSDDWFINLDRLQGFKDINPHVEVVTVSDIPGNIEAYSHTSGLDYLKLRTSSDIVSTMDPDFFWLQPDIFEMVERMFVSEGYEAVGCAGWYPDWVSNFEPRYPERSGHLAPVVWGQFLSRDIVMNSDFVITVDEMAKVYEAGWRVRKYIIENDKMTKTFPGFKYEYQIDQEVCYFGEPERPIGMHLLKGSWAAGRPGGMPTIETINTLLEQAGKKWQ